MANLKKRLAENVGGEFFVDSTCINCDTCRQLAPETFGETADYSFVYHQPQTPELERKAVRALLACPTGSIGTVHSNSASRVKEDFPLLVEGEVCYCGFNSQKSFGGNSYFIRHPAGNWLIDSPKFLPFLVQRFQEWGGITNIFLTHRDDVADADKYAARFASRRLIHRAELEAQPDAELVLEGDAALDLAPEFTVIPTSGHTPGHCVLLFQKRFLFTGDHLDWSRADRELSASRDYCWYSWTKQTESMARLLDYSFEWVLPGHGQQVQLPAAAMRQELARLVRWMHNNP